MSESIETRVTALETCVAVQDVRYSYVKEQADKVVRTVDQITVKVDKVVFKVGGLVVGFFMLNTIVMAIIVSVITKEPPKKPAKEIMCYENTIN